MNSISPTEALSILEKWHEEDAILQFLYEDSRTGNPRFLWVLVNRVNSRGKPSVILSELSDPFPFLSLSLSGAKYEYGDHREFSDDERLLDLAKRAWVSFLAIKMPTGNKMILSELRRDLPAELAD